MQPNNFFAKQDLSSRIQSQSNQMNTSMQAVISQESLLLRQSPPIDQQTLIVSANPNKQSMLNSRQQLEYIQSAVVHQNPPSNHSQYSEVVTSQPFNIQQNNHDSQQNLNNHFQEQLQIDPPINILYQNHNQNIHSIHQFNNNSQQNTQQNPNNFYNNNSMNIQQNESTNQFNYQNSMTQLNNNLFNNNNNNNTNQQQNQYNFQQKDQQQYWQNNQQAEDEQQMTNYHNQQQQLQMQDQQQHNNQHNNPNQCQSMINQQPFLSNDNYSQNNLHLLNNLNFNPNNPSLQNNNYEFSFQQNNNNNNPHNESMLIEEDHYHLLIQPSQPIPNIPRRSISQQQLQHQHQHQHQHEYQPEDKQDPLLCQLQRDPLLSQPQRETPRKTSRANSSNAQTVPRQHRGVNNNPLFKHLDAVQLNNHKASAKKQKKQSTLNDFFNLHTQPNNKPTNQ